MLQDLCYGLVDVAAMLLLRAARACELGTDAGDILGAELLLTMIRPELRRVHTHSLTHSLVHLHRLWDRLGRVQPSPEEHVMLTTFVKHPFAAPSWIALLQTLRANVSAAVSAFPATGISSTNAFSFAAGTAAAAASAASAAYTVPALRTIAVRLGLFHLSQTHA
jgi:hypothetical protein